MYTSWTQFDRSEPHRYRTRTVDRGGGLRDHGENERDTRTGAVIRGRRHVLRRRPKITVQRCSFVVRKTRVVLVRGRLHHVVAVIAAVIGGRAPSGFVRRHSAGSQDAQWRRSSSALPACAIKDRGGRASRRICTRPRVQVVRSRRARRHRPPRRYFDDRPAATTSGVLRAVSTAFSRIQTLNIPHPLPPLLCSLLNDFSPRRHPVSRNNNYLFPLLRVKSGCFWISDFILFLLFA